MFYTYMWLREDGTPYYVGKGSGDRAYIKDTHRHNPPPMGRMVFYIAIDEHEAFENEIALVWYYGRKDLGTGCLRNFTDGGENPPKQFGKRPPEFGRKISASKMGHTFTKETRLKMSASAKNRFKTSMPWNKGVKGAQVAWNKGLHIPWSAARRAAQTIKENT